MRRCHPGRPEGKGGGRGRNGRQKREGVDGRGGIDESWNARWAMERAEGGKAGGLNKKSKGGFSPGGKFFFIRRVYYNQQIPPPKMLAFLAAAATAWGKPAPIPEPEPAGIYNAVLRSDRFGTGHRLDIQIAPVGGCRALSLSFFLLLRLGAAWQRASPSQVPPAPTFSLVESPCLLRRGGRRSYA